MRCKDAVELIKISPPLLVIGNVTANFMRLIVFLFYY